MERAIILCLVAVWSLPVMSESNSNSNSAEDNQWHYHGSNGPANWANLPGNSCGGKHQSPINLVDDAAVFKPELQTLSIKEAVYGQEQAQGQTVENNGHTAEVKFAKKLVGVESGGLPGKFIPVQYHFHWGSDKNQGSEHTINGKRYPLEMHIVHFNQNYDDAADSLSEGDGLAVLAFFFDIDGNANAMIEPLIKRLKDVKKSGGKADLNGMDLAKLMETVDRSNFFRYQGSLTTPPCSQAVTWTLFKEPIKISEEQMAEFRKLLDESHVPIVNNYRPVQLLNDRIIYRSFN